MKRFSELKNYFNEHGNVPVKSIKHPQLVFWLTNQRSLWKSKKLLPERERMLNEAGGDWRAENKSVDWMIRFDQLKLYKERFGNCIVPVEWSENPQLGVWVAKQRFYQKKGKLSDDKKRLLTELGFDWSRQRNELAGK
jgi:hypothetical protein